MNNTIHSNDEGDSDIPVLTDIIEEERSSPTSEVVRAASSDETGITLNKVTAAPRSEDADTDLRAADPHAVDLHAADLHSTDVHVANLHSANLHSANLHVAALPSLEKIEAELSSRLTAELALQIPVVLEAALREHLPKAIGAKLQAELLSALANALPGAAQNAASELSSTLAFEVGGVLEQRLENEVRRAVADEIGRLSEDQQPSR